MIGYCRRQAVCVYSLLIRNRSRHFCSNSKTPNLPTMAGNRLESKDFQNLLTPPLLHLEGLFNRRGYSLRLVGGCVRDLLLGVKPKDVDLATECTPVEMVDMLEAANIRHIPTGMQHGTVTVHIKETMTDYEITTLRVDRETDGRHAVVDFTTDWRLDAERRDLTINAMSLDLRGNLYDYFDGQKHLAERRIVFVGDPVTRIKEDYLRILRYFRFYGRLVCEDGRHEPVNMHAIRTLAPGLRNISVERIWMEMSRILTGRLAPQLVRVMYETGVAESIGLPKDGNFAELERVWEEHRVHALQPVSLLTALVHSEAEALHLTMEWKLSNHNRQLATFVAQHRSIALDTSTPIKYYMDLLVDKAPIQSVLEALHYAGQHRMADQIQGWSIPRVPVNGTDLKEVGIKAGPELGRLLRRLHEKWKESYFTLTKEELLAQLQTKNN